MGNQRPRVGLLLRRYAKKVSNENEKICEHTYKELSELDLGMPYGEQFKGLKIPTFEEILQKFAGRVIMNIHAKIWDENNDASMIEEIVALIRKYDCEKHVYFTTANEEMIRRIMKYAPHLKFCVGWNGDPDPMSTVDRAIALGAYKIQLCKPYFNRETIQKAHPHGIFCNVSPADDPEEVIHHLKMGIDTL